MYIRYDMSRVSAAMCASAAFLYHLQFRSFGASFGGVCIPAFSAILSSLSHLLFPFSPTLSLPCLLRPESCREFQHKCKRWPGRLYELFQFTSANSGSFLLRCFASPSPSPLSLSFSYLCPSSPFLRSPRSLFLFISPSCIRGHAMNRIAEIPHLFSFFDRALPVGTEQEESPG